MKERMYDHGVCEFKSLNDDRVLFQQQNSVVFIGQDILHEYHKRIQSFDDSYKIGQHTGLERYLQLPSERELFAFLNLVRVAPIHCANTVFEILRNRYDFHDHQYTEIVQTKVTDLNQEPPSIQTKDGVSAVDDLIAQLLALQIEKQRNGFEFGSEAVLHPLKWEQRLNHLIDEEQLFELLENQDDFIEYLNLQGLKFKTVRMITFELQNDEADRLFTFESMARLLIDDGDPLWHKKRNALLDPNLRSCMIVIDRDHLVLYVMLFGEDENGSVGSRQRKTRSSF